MDMGKAFAVADRIRDIDPTIAVRTYKTFYLPETADQFDFSEYQMSDVAEIVIRDNLCYVNYVGAGTAVISTEHGGVTE